MQQTTRPERLTRPFLRPPEGLEALGTRLAAMGFFVALAVLETSKEILTARLAGIDRTVGDAIVVNAPWWLFWAVAAPLVVSLAARVPLDRPGRRVRAVAVHAAAAVALVVVHLSGVGLLVHLAVTRGGDYVTAALPAQIRFWIEAYGVLDFFVYWMVIGAWHALAYHRRYTLGRLREEEARTRAARFEQAAAEARLTALRSELDPHFLFNTLNAVSGLVRAGRPRDATTALARLSTFLRATLDRGRDRLTPLAEELRLVALYLEIEEMRLGDRLTTSVSIGEVPPDALVPPLILQPLVENALRHGVAPIPGPARVEVRAELEDGGTLRIEVVDSGPGPGADPPRPGATGLRNVRERLDTLWGARADVVLERLEPRGCRASVRMPLELAAAIEPEEGDAAGPAGRRGAAGAGSSRDSGGQVARPRGAAHASPTRTPPIHTSSTHAPPTNAPPTPTPEGTTVP